jgi:hypothetical protein
MRGLVSSLIASLRLCRAFLGRRHGDGVFVLWNS